MLYQDEVYAIQGAIYEVYKTLGNHLTEPYYQKALNREFQLRNIPAEPQKLIPAMYKGIQIGNYFADFLCFGKIIVEIKAVPELTNEEFHQVNNYLQSGGYDLGLLVNFSEKGKVKPIRILRKGAMDFTVEEDEPAYLPSSSPAD